MGLYQDSLLVYMVCNNGPDTISEITINQTFANFTTTETILANDPHSIYFPTVSGSLDKSSGVWTGTLEATQCIQVGNIGNAITLGQPITFDAYITHSVLSDDSENVDPVVDNDHSQYISGPAVALADLAMTTRLLTPAPITNGTIVSYEVTISNIGLGNYVFDGEPLGMYFIIPAGTSYQSAADADPDDSVSIPQNGCGTALDDVSTFIPAVDSHSPLVGCQFTSTDPMAPGQSTKFIFSLQASEGFANGTTKVYGAVAGNDADSALFQGYLLTGLNPFTQGLNNSVVLAYDGDALTVTINRCSGTGAVVNTNDACFTINFSKPIYTDSFDVSDLVLTGGGNVYSFVQNSSTQWTVRINGMTPNGTLTLSLGAASVVDLSAVNNGTQVLGENVVRYEVPGSTSSSSNAAGLLAETGKNTLVVAIIAIALLSVGIILVASTRKQSSHQ